MRCRERQQSQSTEVDAAALHSAMKETLEICSTRMRRFLFLLQNGAFSRWVLAMEIMPFPTRSLHRIWSDLACICVQRIPSDVATATHSRESIIILLHLFLFFSFLHVDVDAELLLPMQYNRYWDTGLHCRAAEAAWIHGVRVSMERNRIPSKCWTQTSTPHAPLGLFTSWTRELACCTVLAGSSEKTAAGTSEDMLGSQVSWRSVRSQSGYEKRTRDKNG